MHPKSPEISSALPLTALASLDADPTETARRRYDRIASVYDAVEWLMEVRARRWRRDLWSRAESGRVLELGVGAGKEPAFPTTSRTVAAVPILMARTLHICRRITTIARLPIARRACDPTRRPSPKGESMHPPEDDEYAFCADCDLEVSIFDRVYPLGKRRALCFDCATERDGVYQDLLERWTVSPRLDDLQSA